MRKTLKAIIVSIAILSLSSLRADAQTDKLTDFLSRVKLLTADFTQTKHSSMLSAPAVSKGVLTYGEGRMRWQYTSPVQTVKEFDLGSGRRYGPESFDIVWTEGNPSKAVLTPKKKDLQRVFSSIEVEMDADCNVHTVILREGGDDFTRIDFSNQRNIFK